MAIVKIYTDGSCLGNPGPGGWAAILVYGKTEKEICGGSAKTTNNRMELLGAITAFEALNRPCEVEFCSDSKYVIDALQKGWAISWRERGWRRSDGSAAVNPELWERLLTAIAPHKITYVWVKGHAGHPYNERCDALAKAQAEKYRL